MFMFSAAPNGLPGVSMLPPPTTTVGDSVPVPVTVKPPASAGNHAPTFSFFNNPYAIPKPQCLFLFVFYYLRHASASEESPHLFARMTAPPLFD